MAGRVTSRDVAAMTLRSMLIVSFDVVPRAVYAAVIRHRQIYGDEANSLPECWMMVIDTANGHGTKLSFKHKFLRI